MVDEMTPGRYREPMLFHKETSWRSWPDAETGPWRIDITTAIVGGRWELVGLSIQPLGPPRVLTSIVLKQMRLPKLFAQHQRQIRAANKSLTASGPGRVKVTLRGRNTSPADAEHLLNVLSSAAPRTGRPTHWNPSRLAEVARTYREAWIARKHPTNAVALRFHLSASGAAKVVRLARAAKLLPPTGKGKAGWIETPPKEDRKDSKERKR